MRLARQLARPYLLDALALIAGGLLPFAFAPFTLWIFALLAPALLLATWLHCSPRHAFWRGLLFGASFFGIGASWVFNSIYTYGNTALSVAVLITAAFILVLAAFIGVQGYMLTRLFPRNNWRKLLFAFPASWVLFEWLRSLFLTGFPWLFLGYSQITSPLRGVAPLLSVYGVSFFTAFSSAALLSLFCPFRRRVKVFIIVAVLLIWAGCAALTSIRWTQPQGKPLKVSLIQGNVPILTKWDINEFQKNFLLYKKLTKQQWHNQIIVWPEAAITLYNTQAKTYLDELATTATQHHTAIITGIPVFLEDRSYNGMMVIGNGKGIYLKRHLVPFGEYIPLQHWLGGLLQFLDIPMSNFSRGPAQQIPLLADKLRVAPFICYEIAYPNEVLKDFPEAELIIVVTEDGWFGKSFASAQQLQIAQMRALETGRYLLSATNTGVTAIVNPQGQIQIQAPLFQTTAIQGTVQAMTGRTPVMYGNIYPCIILMVLLLLLLG